MMAVCLDGLNKSNNLVVVVLFCAVGSSSLASLGSNLSEAPCNERDLPSKVEGILDPGVHSLPNTSV